MKIKETIERDCCDFTKDLLPYKGNMPGRVERLNPKFCVHCGQVWIDARKPDAASSTETFREQLQWEIMND